MYVCACILVLYMFTAHVHPFTQTHAHSLIPSHTDTHTHTHTHTHARTHTRTRTHTSRDPTLPTHSGDQPLVDVLSGVGGWAAANITEGIPWNYSQLTLDQIAGSQAFFAFSVGADPVNSSQQTIFVSVPKWCGYVYIVVCVWTCMYSMCVHVVCVCVCVCVYFAA